MSPPTRRIALTEPAALAAALATVAMVALVPVALTGAISPGTAAALSTLAMGAAALAAAALNARAGRREPVRVARRVRLLIAVGLTSWGLSTIPYAVFAASGGDPSQPAAWTQIGYLAAYPFWYRALWLLRPPSSGEPLGTRLNRIGVEITALAVLAGSVFGLLWVHTLSAAENVALLLPICLDLLLAATLYTAIRRTRLSVSSAQTWVGVGFALLFLTDAAVTFLTPRGHLSVLAAAVLGYPMAMGLLGHSASLEIRVTFARNSLRKSTLAVGALSLALLPAAILVAPHPVLVPAYLVLNAFVAWRVLASIRVESEVETDAESGFLLPQAFERHVSGVVSAATEERQAVVAVVDLADFASWSADHGRDRGEAVLRTVASRLESLDGLGNGIWGRLSPDRFAFAGMTSGPEEANAITRAIQEAAATVVDDLDAHAGVALAPQDAPGAPEAIAAAQDALVAGRRVLRPVTAFDRWNLDGADAGGTYTQELREIRGRIGAVLGDPDLTRIVFQPIVDLESGRVVAYECLTRFECEPRQGPDVWIAEAHRVGLGVELEAALFARALLAQDRAPEGRYLSINASPALIMSPLLEQVLVGAAGERIVLEITEHDQVANYGQIASRLATLRGRGIRTAVDDAGAGHSSLRHVLQLQPDFIKLDRSLIRDIEGDPARRAVVRSMVTLSAELGASLVAEGIETGSELWTLRELGVRIGQGYFLGRPGPDFVTACQIASTPAG